MACLQLDHLNRAANRGIRASWAILSDSCDEVVRCHTPVLPAGASSCAHLHMRSRDPTCSRPESARLVIASVRQTFGPRLWAAEAAVLVLHGDFLQQ